MRYISLALTLLTLGLGTFAAHVSRNDSSVIVTYEGHAEAPRPAKTVTGTSKPGTTKTGTSKTGTSKTGTSKAVRTGTGDVVVFGSGTDAEYLDKKDFLEFNPSNNKNLPTDGPDVVFIPSGNQDSLDYRRNEPREREPPREREREDEREREIQERKIRLNDVVHKHTLGDIINDRVVRVETERPNEGILFISGKNNENSEKVIKKEEESRRSYRVEKEFKEVAKAPLNCNNLNCNNTLKSVCGVRREQNRPKYRLFLNECYYRKVNCGFSYDYNRYKVAPREKCANVGSHFTGRPDRLFDYEPRYFPLVPPKKGTDKEDSGFRRSISSRRALTSFPDGERCAHACPTRCLEDYSPECAYAGTQFRVFLNHCQLDLHSCNTATAWQKRPLSDCVGPKKAEVQNNRAFIGWMQRVGIVDKKGRMVLN